MLIQHCFNVCMSTGSVFRIWVPIKSNSFILFICHYWQWPVLINCVMCYYLYVLRWPMWPILVLNCLLQMEQERSEEESSVGDVLALAFRCARFCSASLILFASYSPAPQAGLGGSVGCAIRLETRRSRVQPLPWSATFFRRDWSWNIFYGHSLPSADSRRAVVSFWWENVHNAG